MKLSTWMRFMRDYLTGVVRKTRDGNALSISFRREAIRRYFANIDAKKYIKHHTSMNTELFTKYVSTEIKARVKPAWSIVDIGAGFCDLEYLLVSKLPQYCKLICADIHFHMLLTGKKRLGENAIHNNTSIFYLVTDAEKCALFDACADLVVCVNVTPYLMSLNHLFNEVAHLLKENGEFILVQPKRNFFWEEAFEGVKLNFFNDNQTEEVCKHHGFAVTKTVQLKFYFLPLLKFFSTVYASMFVFRKVRSK